MNVTKIVLATVTAVVAAACEGGGGGLGVAQPGTMEVRLGTAVTNAGAIRFTISGGSSSTVAAATGYRTYSTASGSTQNVIVTGSLASGVLATFTIPDRLQATAYSAQVSEVAATRTYALLSDSAFALSLALTGVIR